MRYAQIRSGQKLHLVFEPGEGWERRQLVPAGRLSQPICGMVAKHGYRMTINVPLAHACKRCIRVARARGLG